MPQSPQQGDDSARIRPSALAHVLARLHRKSRSEAFLRADLAALGYGAGDIDDAIERAQGYGYVHDGRLADSVAAAAKRRGKGPLWVRMQLAERQVATAARSEALAQSAEEADATADAALANKARRWPRPLDARAIAKLGRFLASRGFTQGCAGRAIDRLLAADRAEKLLDGPKVGMEDVVGRGADPVSSA